MVELAELFRSILVKFRMSSCDILFSMMACIAIDCSEVDERPVARILGGVVLFQEKVDL